jgi:hypothetical protein
MKNKQKKCEHIFESLNVFLLGVLNIIRTHVYIYIFEQTYIFNV